MDNSYQAYDNYFFLELNLHKLEQEQLNEIIQKYFVEEGVVELSKEYKGTVYVNEREYKMTR